jgi:hypothetical protein
MYDTLLDGVKGAIEEKTPQNNSIFISGWAFSDKYGVCPIRCKYDGSIKAVNIKTRPDICDKFNRKNIILCGWTIEVPSNKYCDIQIKLDSEWHTFLSFNTTNVNNPIPKNEIIMPESTIQPVNSVEQPDNISLDKFIKDAMVTLKNKFPDMNFSKANTAVLDISLTKSQLPSIITIDDFYANPDSVRHIGLLNNPPLQITHSEPNFKNVFEKALGTEIDTFTKYESQNIFVKTTSTEPIMINTNISEYTAIIFLTPDAPLNTGVTLYRSKHTKKMSVSESEKTTVFKNGNQDITEFEPVDIIGNIYNRAVIFNSQLIHAISHNFGTTPQNGRLVQMFAFDTKKQKSDTTKISLNL